MRRRAFLISGAGLLACQIPRAEHEPADQSYAPRIGRIVFTEQRPYGTVVCGSEGTMLVNANGAKIFAPESVA